MVFRGTLDSRARNRSLSILPKTEELKADIKSQVRPKIKGQEKKKSTNTDTVSEKNSESIQLPSASTMAHGVMYERVMGKLLFVSL